MPTSAPPRPWCTQLKGQGSELSEDEQILAPEAAGKCQQRPTNTHVLLAPPILHHPLTWKCLAAFLRPSSLSKFCDFAICDCSDPMLKSTQHLSYVADVSAESKGNSRQPQNGNQTHLQTCLHQRALLYQMLHSRRT